MRIHKTHARVQRLAAQRLLEKITHDGQRALRPLPPVVAAQRDAAVVEAHPRPAHQLRVHEDEPAIGVVLRGAGFARHIGADAKSRADAPARALVHHTAQGIAQGLRRLHRQHLLRGHGGKLLQHPALAVFNAGHPHRGPVSARVGNGAVGRHHLFERDRAGAQRQRGHQF